MRYLSHTVVWQRSLLLCCAAVISPVKLIGLFTWQACVTLTSRTRQATRQSCWRLWLPSTPTVTFKLSCSCCAQGMSMPRPARCALYCSLVFTASPHTHKNPPLSRISAGLGLHKMSYVSKTVIITKSTRVKTVDSWPMAKCFTKVVPTVTLCGQLEKYKTVKLS